MYITLNNVACKKRNIYLGTTKVCLMKLYLPFCLIATLSILFTTAQNVSYTPLFTDASFNARTIDLSKPVGTVDGTAGVSASGGATYTIPFQVPQGINGLQPSINLIYSSQGGNGIAGMGWSLTGVSAITRGGDDIYHDGNVTPVDYSNNDNFYLDGMRLYATTGNNGADGSIYATEAESYSKIISHGNTNNAPDWFEVISKDGTNYKYSIKFLSDDGSKNMYWQLARITDVAGNSIDFTYTQYDRESLLTSINYAKNDAAGKPSMAKIVLTYALRSDINKLYEAGSSITAKYVLTKIIEWVDVDVPFKTYIFNYGYGNLVSYLNEVQEQGSDNNQLNSTIFKYNNTPPNLTTSVISTVYSQADLFVGDFDADGKSDILSAHVYYDNLYIKHHDSYTLNSDLGTNSGTLMYSANLSAGSLVDGIYNKNSKTSSFG